MRWVFVLVMLLGTEAYADTYINSSEEICGESYALICDDFEDGSWHEDQSGTANANNDGFWNTKSTFPSGEVPFITTPGINGTSYAARLHKEGGGEGGVDGMADHELPREVTETHARFYVKCIAVGDCSWSTNTKLMFTWNHTGAGDGIQFGNVGAIPPDTDAQPDRCNTNFNLFSGCKLAQFAINPPVEQCHPDDEPFYPPGDDCIDNTYHQHSARGQNQGQNLYLDGTVKEWYYVEYYIKFNTPPLENGKWKLWVAQCGSSGNACDDATPATSYLRSDHNDVTWLFDNGTGRGGDGGTIKWMWFEWYSSGDGTNYVLNGDWAMDQVVVVEGDQYIGPMGTIPGDITPPAAPVSTFIVKEGNNGGEDHTTSR